ncbi:hypothetical protein EsH8_V_001033 [Colletotrichum jinshuiense]
MCPGCSGESPAVPRTTPIADEWQRDNSQDTAWAQGYVSEYCNSALLWIRARFDADDVSNEEMVEVWYRSLFLERRCKEDDHRVGVCRCDANGPLGFLYNPASAARRYLTDQAAEKLEKDWRVQSGEMQQVFATRHAVLSAMCQEQNLCFGGGIGRQPFFSEQAVRRRRRTLTKKIEHNLRAAQDAILRSAEDLGSWSDVHTLESTQTARRASLINFMGEVLLHDSGISNGRLGLAIDRLAHVILLPESRQQSRIASLERVAEVASSTDRGSKPDDPFMCFVQAVQKYYFTRRKQWNVEVQRYKARRALFDTIVEPFDVTDPWGLTGPNGKDECVICNTPYFDAPSAADLSADASHGADMSGHGEPPVRIKACGDLFGRRCLFQWMTDPTASNREPRCPSCDAELPFVAYQLVEAAMGLSLRHEPPGEL